MSKIAVTNSPGRQRLRVATKALRFLGALLAGEVSPLHAGALGICVRDFYRLLIALKETGLPVVSRRGEGRIVFHRLAPEDFARWVAAQRKGASRP